MNSLPDISKKIIDAADPEALVERMFVQRAEVVGDDNMWFTGEAVKHPPNKQEAGIHWATHGGPEDFNKRHPRE